MGGSGSSGSSRNFFGSSNQQAIQPLALTQPPHSGGMANQNVLSQLEGRYVAPTGAGFQYYQGGPTNTPFNPLMLQAMLQQVIARQSQQQAQQQSQQPRPVIVDQMFSNGQRAISR